MCPESPNPVSFVVDAVCPRSGGLHPVNVNKRLGATLLPNEQCRFMVWAPGAERVTLEVVNPDPRRVCMERDGDGYHTATVPNLGPGARYMYQLGEGSSRPDPASRSQPDGVHAA